jgi:threonine/homoserine/homoserine lactone efflux protein
MVSGGALAAFSLIALGIVLVPGPNMIYVLSRTLTLGQAAGLIAVSGVTLGTTTHMLAAAFGLTTLIVEVPHALDCLRVAGAVYLTYLAGITLTRPSSLVDARGVSAGRGGKLFGLGLLVSLLNPAIALLYLTLLPQFIDPVRGSVLGQSLVLGLAHILIGVAVNSVVVVMAKAFARFAARPRIAQLQRLATSFAIAVLAARTVLSTGTLPSGALATPKQVEVAPAHEFVPVSREPDRGIPDARRLPGFAFDPFSPEEYGGDRAIARSSKAGIESAQTCTQTNPLLVGQIGAFGPFAFLNVAPEPKRRLGTLVDVRVQWQERRQRAALEGVIRDPKAMFTRSVSQKHVHAVDPRAKGRSSLPIAKQ